MTCTYYNKKIKKKNFFLTPSLDVDLGKVHAIQKYLGVNPTLGGFRGK